MSRKLYVDLLYLGLALAGFGCSEQKQFEPDYGPQRKVVFQSVPVSAKVSDYNSLTTTFEAYIYDGVYTYTFTPLWGDTAGYEPLDTTLAVVSDTMVVAYLQEGRGTAIIGSNVGGLKIFAGEWLERFVGTVDAETPLVLQHVPRSFTLFAQRDGYVPSATGYLDAPIKQFTVAPGETTGVYFLMFKKQEGKAESTSADLASVPPGYTVVTFPFE